MAFTVIPNGDIDPGSPGSTDLFTKLRDNDDFLFAQRAGLILVEKKLVTADVQDLTFAGLDGDVDEVYKLFGRIVVSGAAEDVSLQPNGGAAAQSSLNIIESSAAVARTTPSILTLVETISASEVLQIFEATFFAKKDPNSIAVNRVLKSDWATYTATAVSRVGQSRGLWDEDVTNITSLVVHGEAADTIRDGSTVALYKLRQS